MKKNEIEIGKDYAISWDSDYRGATWRGVYAHKVTVLGEAYTERDFKTRSVVPVRYANGKTGVVATREFREEWAPYAAYLAEVQASQAVARKRKSADIRDRLRKARALAADLEKVGVPVETTGVYDVNQAQSLANFGLLVTESESTGRPTFVAPLAPSLIDYIFKGSKIQVSGDALLQILEARR